MGPPGYIRTPCLGGHPSLPAYRTPDRPPEAATMGRTFVQKSVFFLKKPLVRGSWAAWGRTVSQKCVFFGRSHVSGALRCLGQNFFQTSGFVEAYNVNNLNRMHFQKFWDSCAQNKTSEISKNKFSGIVGLLCAEQNVRNLNKCTFNNSGTPVRRTKRRNI